MLMFLGFVVVVIAAAILGAKYHVQINEKVKKILNANEELPVDFRVWLERHKGEYSNLGAAMAAWADAKYGSKFDNLLK